MRATFKLLNSYFWKTYYGPIMSFVFPTILLAILGNIFETKYVFPGVIAMSTLFIAVLALPLGLMELRGSSLFKYIGASPVNPKKFSLIAIGFYVIIILVANIILFAFAFILFKDQIFTGSDDLLDVKPYSHDPTVPYIPPENEIYGELAKLGIDKNSSEAISLISKYINGDVYHTMVNVTVSTSIFSNLETVSGMFQFLFADILHIMFAIMFGLAIATFSKTPQQALTTAIIIIIPSIFLSGMVVSVDIIASSKVMQWVSRLIPFRYTTGNLVEATAPLSELSLYMTPEQVQLMMGDEGKVLRQMILQEQYPLVAQSSSGIFDFTSDFSVRRIPDVDQIRSFMVRYLAGGSHGHVDPSGSRFMGLWNSIQSNQWGWLDLFLNQNNMLYTQAEKVINIFGPIVASMGLGIYVTKNFKWTTR